MSCEPGFTVTHAITAELTWIRGRRSCDKREIEL